MAEKPTAAFVLSIIAGIFFLIGAILWFTIFATVGFLFTVVDPGAGTIVTVLGALGFIWAILTIVGAVMFYTRPQQTKMWGAIVLVASILSWFGAIGGFVIGFILGLIGGILALVWKPPAQVGVPPPPPATGP